MHNVLLAAQVLTGAGAVAGIVYYALCLWSAADFLREQPTTSDDAGPFPPVSILKPLKGTDPEMYESFRSHCLQDYPQYETIFGVSDRNDPAIANVERLQREFPKRAIRLVICENILGSNVKVSNLIQMLPQARYDCLIVNDSDIRVEPDYLRRAIRPLADANTGMVTCLYRGIAASTLGSRLESLGISTDFSAGVLTARKIEGGVRFGLGSTLAFRRNDLEAIGGFGPLVDYLVDDYELGRRIAALGKRVLLSDVVVETFLPPYTWSEFFRHQVRWARGVRDSRRGGYKGLVLTYGTLWGALAVIASRGATWTWGLFALAYVLRLAQALVVGRRILHDPQVTRWLWLLPLRDLVAVLVWLGSFAGNTVTWRGDDFHLRDGKLVRVEPS